MNFHEFLSMNGHGPFIWGAYGMSALLLVLEVWLIRRCSAQMQRGSVPVTQWKAGEGWQ